MINSLGIQGQGHCKGCLKVWTYFAYIAINFVVGFFQKIMARYNQELATVIKHYDVLRSSPLMILKGQSLQGQGHKRLYQS